MLRVGTLTPVGELDPRRTQELGTVMVLTQVFEPPFELPTEDRPPKPLLFAEPLRSEERRHRRSRRAMRPGVALLRRHAAHRRDRRRLAGLAPRWWRGPPPWRRAASGCGSGCGGRTRASTCVLSQSYTSIVLERGGKVLGTGPFVIAEAGGEAGVVRLERNPHHRQPVPLDEVEFRTYPGAEALAAAVDAGEVDLTSALSRDDVARVREARKQFLPGASTAILYFNTERPGLDDVAAAARPRPRHRPRRGHPHLLLQRARLRRQQPAAADHGQLP